MAAAFFLVVGCNSTYVRNRARDAADIITVEVQTRAYGAGLRAGPLKIGAYYKSPRGVALGLRSGHMGAHHTAEFTALLFGADYYSAAPLTDLLPPAAKKQKNASKARAGRKESRPKRRKKKVSLPALKGPRGLIRKRGKEYRARAPLGTMQPAHKYKSVLKAQGRVFAPGHYFTQVEISLGAFMGVKVGLNPGELLDFLLGIFGLDIFGDDAPFPDPRLKKLEKNPYFRSLSPEDKARFLKEYRQFNP